MTTLLDLALTPAQGGPRECGPGRQASHIYAECGFSAGGAPIEQFLIDYPQGIDLTRAGFSTQGMNLVTRGDVHHLVDIIGAEHYPHVADFVEEARAIGISRKIPRTFDFSKLTAQSTMIFIHAKAAVRNAPKVAAGTGTWSCPCGKGHLPTEPCAAYHWYSPPPTVAGTSVRRLQRASYTVRSLMPGMDELELTSGYFMRVPISNLTVILKQDGTIDQTSRARANQSSLPIIDADT